MNGLSKKNQNLRDHMTDLELIFTMLGEKEITKKEELSSHAKVMIYFFPMFAMTKLRLFFNEKLDSS